ncbi:DUF748 domain-containing protein [Bizionia sp. KMM 8389]
MTNKRKIVLKSLATVLILILLFLFFLPTLIKNYAVKNGKELTGREIAIGNLKYNYFSSTIKVSDFKMFEANSSEEFTSFDTLIVNLEPLKLFQDNISIEQIYLKGLKSRVIMKDSTFNFDDLIAFHLPESDTLETETIESEPLKYNLSNLELKDSNFFFDNKNINKETHIENLSFFIPYIGWDQEHKSNADIKFDLKNGGSIRSTLNLNPVDGEFDAEIILNNLNLSPFYEYVLEYANISSFEGLLNSNIKIEGNTNQPTNALVSGHVDVADFLLTDTEKRKVLASNRIDVALKKIDYANSAYVIDSLSLKQPYTYFEMDSVTNNIFKLFKLDPEGNPIASNPQPVEVTTIDSTNTSEDELYYAINNFEITNGILDYTDNLTGDKFDYHLSDIEIDTKNIDSQAEWVDIYATMLLNNRGTLNAKIGYNPTNTLYTNLDITIEKFLLSDINIYANYYTGHNIVEGDFYYYSESIITNGDIQSENKLLVKNVSVTNNKSGLSSLPLKFALFLLKDKNGDVNLDIPVRGNLNDPEVNVKKIVWTTFKNLIVKTVASPVNFLAGLVDGDPKELKEFTFNYTDTILAEKQYKKLDKLLELETKKEGLQINLTHFTDPELQKEAIAYAEIEKKFRQDTKNDYLKDEKEFETYLKLKTGNDSLTQKEAVYKVIGSTVLDSLSHNYTNKLIDTTTEYLKSKKDSTNITVSKSDPREPDNKGSLSRFKIDYTLLEPE